MDFRRTEKNFRTVIEHVRDGVYAIRTNKIIWFNQQLCDIFGYSPEDIEGIYIARLFQSPEHYATYEKELYFSLSEKGYFKGEFLGKHKNGDILNLECSVSCMNDTYSTNGEMLVIVRDITEKMRLQERILHSERLAATGKLAASLAHEINNPLQGIMASISYMKNELSANGNINKSLTIAEAGLKRISTVVNQLLDLHRTEGYNKHWIDINQVIFEVILLTKRQLLLHKIKVRQDLSRSIPEIYASSQQVHQILVNLILNAQDSMPDGGEIQIATSQNGEYVAVKIADQGRGIDMKDLPYIFDPFYSTKKKLGTGLGLSVVHAAIEAHGGKILVSSEPDKGTEFTVLVPIQSNSIP